MFLYTSTTFSFIFLTAYPPMPWPRRQSDANSIESEAFQRTNGAILPGMGTDKNPPEIEIRPAMIEARVSIRSNVNMPKSPSNQDRSGLSLKKFNAPPDHRLDRKYACRTYERPAGTARKRSGPRSERSEPNKI